MLATPVLFVIWSGLLVAIAVIDVGAYLVAAGRAQAAADAAALAAVGIDVEPAGTPPVQAARVVAQRNGGEVESCTCRLGSGRAEVRVSVAVYGLFVPRVTGAQRVTAVARAELAALVVGRTSRSPPAVIGRARGGLRCGDRLADADARRRSRPRSVQRLRSTARAVRR